MITFLKADDTQIYDGKINDLLKEIPLGASGIRSFPFKLHSSTDAINVTLYIKSGTLTLEQFALTFQGTDYTPGQKIEIANIDKDQSVDISIKQTIPAGYEYASLDFVSLGVEWEE